MVERLFRRRTLQRLRSSGSVRAAGSLPPGPPGRAPPSCHCLARAQRDVRAYTSPATRGARIRVVHYGKDCAAPAEPVACGFEVTLRHRSSWRPRDAVRRPRTRLPAYSRYTSGTGAVTCRRADFACRTSLTGISENSALRADQAPAWLVRRNFEQRVVAGHQRGRCAGESRRRADDGAAPGARRERTAAPAPRAAPAERRGRRRRAVRSAPRRAREPARRRASAAPLREDRAERVAEPAQAAHRRRRLVAHRLVLGERRGAPQEQPDGRRVGRVSGSCRPGRRCRSGRRSGRASRGPRAPARRSRRAGRRRRSG